jgi:hypothetical protein
MRSRIQDNRYVFFFFVFRLKMLKCLDMSLSCFKILEIFYTLRKDIYTTTNKLSSV